MNYEKNHSDYFPNHHNINGSVHHHQNLLYLNSLHKSFLLHISLCLQFNISNCDSHYNILHCHCENLSNYGNFMILNNLHYVNSHFYFYFNSYFNVYLNWLLNSHLHSYFHLKNHSYLCSCPHPTYSFCLIYYLSCYWNIVQIYIQIQIQIQTRIQTQTQNIALIQIAI